MREILFKAKRLDNSEWVEGFYQKRHCELDKIEHLIFWSKSETVWEYAKIDPETLCQYTGLTDKNKKKIWENDVVKKGFYTDYEHYANSEEYIGKVEYENCTYNIVTGLTSEGDKCIRPMFIAIEFGESKYYEVLGNIFDNPGLVEV